MAFSDKPILSLYFEKIPNRNGFITSGFVGTYWLYKEVGENFYSDFMDEVKSPKTLSGKKRVRMTRRLEKGFIDRLNKNFEIVCQMAKDFIRSPKKKGSQFGIEEIPTSSKSIVAAISDDNFEENHHHSGNALVFFRYRENDRELLLIQVYYKACDEKGLIAEAIKSDTFSFLGDVSPVN